MFNLLLPLQVETSVPPTFYVMDVEQYKRSSNECPINLIYSLPHYPLLEGILIYFVHLEMGWF